MDLFVVKIKDESGSAEVKVFGRHADTLVHGNPIQGEPLWIQGFFFFRKIARFEGLDFFNRVLLLLMINETRL